MLSCRGCGKTHTQWFGIDVPTVFEVVESWGKWLALDVYTERGLDAPWLDKLHLLVYVEGKSWKDTWNDWVSIVITEKERKDQEDNVGPMTHGERIQEIDMSGQKRRSSRSTPQKKTDVKTKGPRRKTLRPSNGGEETSERLSHEMSSAITKNTLSGILKLRTKAEDRITDQLKAPA